MNPLSHSRFLRRIALAAVVMVAAGAAQAKTEQFQDLTIEVVGSGRPVLMIPGLNSAGETWRETCAALQADKVQCHIVQFPGFAGAAPIKTENFCESMRDRLLAYIKARKLARPVVMGHSLGGFIGLEMAIAQPQAIDRLVIVDALAFLGALQNPAATAESMRPRTEAMRKQMTEQDAESYHRGVANAVKGMTLDEKRVATLIEWGKASDRATTAQAMYEMMSTDLRPQLTKIQTPTLVLGSWAAYATYGATKETTTAIFKTQYAGLNGVAIEVSQAGYHFLMWDDPTWLQDQVRGFIGAKAGDGG
ncbi:alpha/beta fold hydrolase [Lysobacter sp. CA199]|uniref:alpha/beta fold hydrolase n=1 Tax=Lysobacter sp. CA199 TaxID=3455608 RepID=UPI003F8D535B